MLQTTITSLRNRLSSKIVVIMIAIIIAIISFSIFSQNLSSYSFYHGDEGFWIETGKWTFQKFIIERDFSKEQWWTKELRSFGAVNPNFGKLIIGASLCINQYCHFSGLPKWDFSQSVEWNIKQGHAASKEELKAARIIIVVITSISASILFIITATITRWNVLGGIYACIAFLTHTLVLTLGRQVMLDMPAILFSLMAVSAAYKSVNSTTDKPIIFWSFLTALCGGLAISTKLNTGLVFIAIIIIGIVNVVIHRDRRSYFFLVINSVVPPLVFLAFNPQFWSNLINGIQYVLAFSQSVTDSRHRFPRDALWSISDQLMAYYQRIPGNLFNLSLFVLGLILITKDLKTTWPILVYGLCSSLGVILWTPLNWDRYYLSAVPFYTLVLGFLISKITTPTLITSKQAN